MPFAASRALIRGVRADVDNEKTTGLIIRDKQFFKMAAAEGEIQERSAINIGVSPSPSRVSSSDQQSSESGAEGEDADAISPLEDKVFTMPSRKRSVLKRESRPSPRPAVGLQKRVSFSSAPTEKKVSNGRYSSIYFLAILLCLYLMVSIAIWIFLHSYQN